MTGEGAGRTRTVAENAAKLARARYTRLAGQLRDAADTAERAAAALAGDGPGPDADLGGGTWVSVATLGEAARTLRGAAVLAEDAADAAGPRY